MVNKHSLALRIDELRFNEILPEALLVGEGDRKKNIYGEESVKEDLFEAIIGAVALDSNWNLDVIQETVEIMLDPESFIENDDTNYVMLIQQWEERKNGSTPLFKYPDYTYEHSWYFQFEGITKSIPLGTNISDYRYTCELKLLDELPIFRAFGKSKQDARKAVCELAYHYLEDNDLLFSIRDEIENPNFDEAISQLEILARRGYFSVPSYEFNETYDNNGNPIWKATCIIKEIDRIYNAKASSKKTAKKEAAYSMLMHILGQGPEDR